MTTQETYDIIIQAIEDTACARKKDYFEELPDPAELAETAFSSAECYGMTGKAINSIFNFMTKMTFNQYFDTRVMMYAYSVLLNQESYDSSELINIIGVSSDSALYKKFKKTFNISPKEAFEKKDSTLLVSPAYWDTLSAKQHDGFESAIEKDIKQGIPEEYFNWAIRETDRKARLPYKNFRVILLLIIIALVIAVACFIRKGWEGNYTLLRITSENEHPISHLVKEVTYTIDPFKNQIIETGQDGSQRIIKGLKIKKNKEISWTDKISGYSYTGLLYNDKSIICYEYLNGEQTDSQLRLIPTDIYNKWKDNWDGYYEVYVSDNGYSVPNGYSATISIDGAMFILSDITGDDTQIGWIFFPSTSHIAFTLSSYENNALQCNLTGEDTFTVSELNSDEVLFKCFKVLE